MNKISVRKDHPQRKSNKISKDGLSFKFRGINENTDSGHQLELHYASFDWDDNILHMPTKIHMDKLINGKWTPVSISTEEFAIVRNDKENYRIRNNDPVVAFAEFRDHGPRGKMAFMEDSIDALNNGDLAPSWNDFIESLSNGTIFSIITARGHEPETIRGVVEWIIDNILTRDQKDSLYDNCLKNAYLFLEPYDDIDRHSRIPRGRLSKTPLVEEYLDHCDFFGVSSDSFAKRFGATTASNPEKAKELALQSFVDKCNNYGRKVGAKKVSIGFSDDDPKNVDHIDKHFKETSALSFDLPHQLKLNIFKTTKRGEKPERKRYIGDEEKTFETSHQTPGLESSVLPFMKWSNLTQNLFPSNDRPQDSYHNQFKNRVRLTQDLAKISTSKVKRKRKKRK